MELTDLNAFISKCLWCGLYMCNMHTYSQFTPNNVNYTNKVTCSDRELKENLFPASAALTWTSWSWQALASGK